MRPRSPREISVLVPPDLAPLYPDDPSRIGPYLVLGRLGQGATGTVYAAVDVSPSNADDRLVAVKTLKSPELENPDVFPALEQRLRALSTVDAERVVTPLAYDADANPPWLSMPYLAGERLSHYITKRGELSTGRLIALATGLAEGLSVLHARKVSHGSLRPSEILLGSSGPHIMECAVAANASRLRGAGATWLGPERFQGGPPSPAADVFAWGAVVAFAGTGRLPFGTGEPEEIAERAAQGHFELDGLIKGLEPVVSRALDPDPERRPSLREVMGAVIAVWQAEQAEETEETEEQKTPLGHDELSRLLEREWHGVEPPHVCPRVVRLEGRMAAKRPTGPVPRRNRDHRTRTDRLGSVGITRLLTPCRGGGHHRCRRGRGLRGGSERGGRDRPRWWSGSTPRNRTPRGGTWVYTPVDRTTNPCGARASPVTCLGGTVRKPVNRVRR